MELLSSRSIRKAQTRLVFRELTRCEDLHDYLVLRHRVYSAQGYWAADSRTLDLDCYDRHSRFVGAFTSAGELIGGARFIMADGSPNAAALDTIQRRHSCAPAAPRACLYYAQTIFDFDAIVSHAERQGQALVEFGRTVVHPDWQNDGLGLYLVHAIHGLARAYGVKIGLASVPPRLARFYGSSGCRVLQQRSESRSQELSSPAIPVVVDLDRLEGPFRSAIRAGRALRLRGEWSVDIGADSSSAPSAPGHAWSGESSSGHGWEPVLSRLPLLRAGVTVHDETLRDGLQSPSAIMPTLEAKISLLHELVGLGVESANLGLPAAGGLMREHSHKLVRYIGENHLPLKVTLAGRTVPADVQAIASVAQSCGVAVEAGLFLGCSPVRQACEEWDLQQLLDFTDQSVRLAVAEGLQVMFVTEDTTRTPEHILEPLYHAALQAGASAICLTDTVGYATPRGTGKLVRHVRGFLQQHGYQARLDWHGHNDRGLAVANCLAAIEAGVDRVHATLGGCGERVGNACMEQLLVHLRRLSGRSLPLQALERYLAWGRRHLPWVELPAPLEVLPEPARVATVGAVQ